MKWNKNKFRIVERFVPIAKIEFRIEAKTGRWPFYFWVDVAYSTFDLSEAMKKVWDLKRVDYDIWKFNKDINK